MAVVCVVMVCVGSHLIPHCPVLGLLLHLHSLDLIHFPYQQLHHIPDGFP